MAQLKDSVVSGNLRVTDSTLTDTLQTTIIKAPTSSGGTTYGPGTSGQVLKSNGTSVYWTSDDTKVTQNNKTDSANYRVLLSGNANDSNETTTSGKSGNLYFNPSSGILNVSRQVVSAGYSTSDTADSSLYSTGALEVREAGRVGSAQSSFKYAPRIGFHWSGSIAGSLSFHSDGCFYFRKQDGTTRATIDANVSGNASSATYVALPRVTEDAKSFPGTNKVAFKEYSNSSTNTPSSAWYHIISMQGSDNKFGTQLALGMTAVGVYYRNYDAETWSSWQPMGRFTATPTSGQVVITDGTTGGIKSSGYTIATSVPPGAVFTDTKVTSSANHYTPSTASGSDISKSASGATAAWSIDVVKGITLNTDGKGHVTGLSVTSGKIPANPNTNTTYTLGTSGNNVTLTPSSGSVQSITVPYATKASKDGDANTISSTYLKLSGGTMSGNITFSNTTCVVQNQNSTSNYTSTIKWFSGGTNPGDYGPEIGQWNIGGDSSYPGRIIIMPYHTTYSSDHGPWEGDTGLCIENEHVYIDGKELPKYLGNLAGSITGASPASSVKSFYATSSCPPLTRELGKTAMSFGYNSNGAEYSFIFTKNNDSNGTYGSVLKWGYDEPAIFILRKHASGWKTDDWEAIAAPTTLWEDAVGATTATGLNPSSIYTTFRITVGEYAQSQKSIIYIRIGESLSGALIQTDPNWNVQQGQMQGCVVPITVTQTMSNGTVSQLNMYFGMGFNLSTGAHYANEYRMFRIEAIP